MREAVTKCHFLDVLGAFVSYKGLCPILVMDEDSLFLKLDIKPHRF